MDRVSVIEEAGQKIISEITDKSAELLVDPTMILTKEEWTKIERRPSWLTDEKNGILY